MTLEMSRTEASRIRRELMNAPVAPGVLSYLINVGTNELIDVLEREYFESALSEGISCFKYLEGDYGSGKTQFIYTLAKHAEKMDIVTSIVNVGQECPFSSPLAIYKSVMASFLPPSRVGDVSETDRGIDVLVSRWIGQQLRSMGVEHGAEVPEQVKQQVSRKLSGLWVGAPDTQVAVALAKLGKRLLDLECGADCSPLDSELIEWIKGGRVSSKNLKDLGIHEPTKDENAFKRLKTVIGFLRTRLGYRGFFVAFDEGTRTASFRRGSVKQKQAIENMLSMINDNAQGQFEGVMFMYAATPDFRNEVIKNYTALQDRIGSIAFSPGRPMTPLINLDDQNSDEATIKIGERLMDLFERADGGTAFNRQVQRKNISELMSALKEVLVLFDKIPPRYFVYYYCLFLADQRKSEHLIDAVEAQGFVSGRSLTEPETVE